MSHPGATGVFQHKPRSNPITQDLPRSHPGATQEPEATQAGATELPRRYPGATNHPGATQMPPWSHP